MRRQIAAACVSAFALAAGAFAPKSFAEDETPPPAPVDSSFRPTFALPEPYIGRYLLNDIEKARRQAWRWERLMRIRRTRATRAAERTNDADHRRALLEWWKRRAAMRARQAYSLPRLRAWHCIHLHERNPEQGWRTNTGNGFYGGLQMNLHFQRTYGRDLLRRKGTADRWRPIEQIWVAERAYRSGLGFTPWPNTARYCGLL